MSHYARGEGGFNLGKHISRAFIPRPMAAKRTRSRNYGSRKRARSSRFRTRSRAAISVRRTLRNRKRSFRRKRARSSKRMSFGPRITMGSFIKWQKQQIQFTSQHDFLTPNTLQLLLNTISVDTTGPFDYIPLGATTSLTVTGAGNGGFTPGAVTGVDRVWLNRTTVRMRIAVPNGVIPDLGILIQAYKLKKQLSAAGTVHTNPWLYNDTFKDYTVMRKKVIKLKDVKDTSFEQVIDFTWNFNYKKWLYTVSGNNATTNSHWVPSLEDADNLQFSIGSNSGSGSANPITVRWSIIRYFAVTPFTNSVT